MNVLSTRPTEIQHDLNFYLSFQQIDQQVNLNMHIFIVKMAHSRTIQDTENGAVTMSKGEMTMYLGIVRRRCDGAVREEAQGRAGRKQLEGAGEERHDVQGRPRLRVER